MFPGYFEFEYIHTVCHLQNPKLYKAYFWSDKLQLLGLQSWLHLSLCLELILVIVQVSSIAHNIYTKKMPHIQQERKNFCVLHVTQFYQIRHAIYLLQICH